MNKILSPTSLLIIIIAIGSFLRFYNPFWDQGLFLHPDERLFVNASTLSLPLSLKEFFSPSSPLNPHMFYYGSLLLYMYKLVSLISPFSFLITSRIISALFSALTIGIVFGIGKELFSKKIGLLASIFFAFAVGSIQYAHFNTTESSLIFLLSTITYIDILSVKKKNIFFLVLSCVFVAIATAIKITGLTFGVSPFLAFLLFFERGIVWKKILQWTTISLIVATTLFILLTPYQWIDFKEFQSQQSYMQAVTYGVFKPPFVIIYQNSIPYIYQLIQVLPFDFGFFSFPLSLIGLILLLKKLLKQWRNELLILFIFIFPIPYFLWSGLWFAKYARYYLLLLPFLSVWAAYALKGLNKYIAMFLVFFVVVNALLFFRLYTTQNTRIAASLWIYQHLPYHATIATEHWDDTLPLRLPLFDGSYTNVQLKVYDDETPGKFNQLSDTLSHADYLILSSRRVYVSIQNNPNKYPLTNHFYSLLFSNKLGYEKIYDISFSPFFFSDNFADETFQSYDHPPVLIFKNIAHFPPEQIFKLISTR